MELEESLLNESAARESSLNTVLITMESDLRQIRVDNDRLKAEKETLETVRIL